jgi:phospholipase A1
MRIVLLFFLAVWPLAAQTAYETARGHFEAGDYEEAFKGFRKALHEDNDEDACYFIGTMYEHGLGVEQNKTVANEYYKRVAERYKEISEDNRMLQLEKQRRKIYRSFDILEDAEAEETVQQVVESRFSLSAYKTNYLLPFSYRVDGEYANRTAAAYDPLNTEVEFQLSVKLDYYARWFGVDAIYTFGYTQNSFWQLYVKQAYFRENNYNPEIVVSFPVHGRLDDYNIKMFSLSIGHQSNGRGVQNTVDDNGTVTEEDIERAWNYLAGSVLFQTGPLFSELKAWYRLPESPDHNPDLIDYHGYGQLWLRYPVRKHLFSLTWRQNFLTWNGAMELSWSHPIYLRDDMYYYVKVFSGYGESLIDYDNYINKIGIGVAFSR